MEIYEHLFLTKPLHDSSGFYWALTSLLSKMIRLAEEKFGPRDMTYTPVGIEFIDRDYPCICYVGNCKHVAIQLTKNCLSDPAMACFQLAHEAVHLLSPSGGNNGSNLDEGLASHFQIWFMDNYYPWQWPRKIINIALPSYLNAKIAVEELLALDPNAIIELRKKQPAIFAITADLILESYPTFNPTTANFLAKKFIR